MHYEKWTPEALEELREYAKQGLSATEIGKKLGFTRNAVIGKAQRSGIKLYGNQKYNSKATNPLAFQTKIDDEKDALLRKLVSEGYSANAIGIQLGCSRFTVYNRCAAMGISLKKGRSSRGPGAGPGRTKAPAKPRLPADPSTSAPAQPRPKRGVFTFSPLPAGPDAPRVEPYVPVDGVIPEGHKHTLFNVRQNQCKWPLWGHKQHPTMETAFVCGEPVAGIECPYCPTHRRASQG